MTATPAPFKINIICVTKNAEKYLERCLESIALQTYPHIKVIIQDGLSTDSTVDIIKKWEHIVEYWESAPDTGIYDAMNKALNHVSADFIYFIGADDYLYPAYSDLLASDLISKQSVYYGRVEMENKFLTNEYSSYKLTKYNLCHQAMLFPESVFQKYRFDTRYKICADYLLNMQLHHDKLYRLQFVDKVIAVYNNYGFSGMNRDELFEKEKLQHIRHYFSWIDYKRYAFRHARQKDQHGK